MKQGPVLYFDRSLGSSLPLALRVLKVSNVIHHHDDCSVAGLKRGAGEPRTLFTDQTKDDEWLAFAAQRHWIAFSQDYSMHLEAAPLAAIKQHQAKVFYLWGANEPRWQKMRGFTMAYERMLAVAATTPGPFVRRVNRHGHIETVTI